MTRHIVPIITILAAFLAGCSLFNSIQNPTSDTQETQIPSVDSKLQWIYGGYNGSKSTCLGDFIRDLKLGQKDMAYSWTISETDATKLLGSKSKTEPDLLACFFVTDKSGKIVGGKFEWISVSRKTRQFGNIFSGYNGWTLANVPGKTTAYFCIVNPKTNKRTNIISATWVR